jgi:hypothetical protein
MNCLKKHIATILLLGFLFPQVANAVHYLLVPHDYYPQQENLLISGPVYEYHSCDYHFSGIKFLTPEINYSENVNLPEGQKELLIPYVPIIYKGVSFYFRVRGPPAGIGYYQLIQDLA